TILRLGHRGQVSVLRAALLARPLLWKHSQKISVAFHGCCTLPTDGSSPSTPRPPPTRTRGPRRQRNALRHRLGVALRQRASRITVRQEEIKMKQLLSAVLVVTLLFVASPASFAEPRQVMQGTQVHLTLLNSVGTAASR